MRRWVCLDSIAATDAVFSMTFSAVLTPAGEGGYVAFNPETGTTTQGETMDEALKNLQDEFRWQKLSDDIRDRRQCLRFQEFLEPKRFGPLKFWVFSRFANVEATSL